MKLWKFKDMELGGMMAVCMTCMAKWKVVWKYGKYLSGTGDKEMAYRKISLSGMLLWSLSPGYKETLKAVLMFVHIKQLA